MFDEDSDEDELLGDAVLGLEDVANQYTKAAGIAEREYYMLKDMGALDGQQQCLERMAKYKALSLACRFAYEHLKEFEEWANQDTEQVDQPAEPEPEVSKTGREIALEVYRRMTAEGKPRIEILNQMVEEAGIMYSSASAYFNSFKPANKPKEKTGYERAQAVYEEYTKLGKTRSEIIDAFVDICDIGRNSAVNYYSSIEFNIANNV